MTNTIKLDDALRSIQHENLCMGRPCKYIQQDYFPALECTKFWYTSNKPPIPNPYTVAVFRVKNKHNN